VVFLALQRFTCFPPQLNLIDVIMLTGYWINSMHM